MLRRALVIVIAGVITGVMVGLATAAHADDPAASARRLTEALLHSKVEAAPAGLSSPAVARMFASANDSQAGIIGAVRMSFPGRTSNAEIRYAVFSNPDDARRYATNFGAALEASHPQRIFFPYLTEADCVQRGQDQLCAAVSGNVFALALSNGIASAKTHERQTTRGVSAGIVARYALAHLQSARTSLAQSAASATPSAGQASQPPSSDPCAMLTQEVATAALESQVTPSRRSGATCQYNSRVHPGDGVTLQLIEGGRAKFDFDRDRVVGAQPVSGIGDGAFEFVSLAGFAQVYVLRGERYFSITLTKQHDRNLRESAAAAARKIAGLISH